MNTTKPCRHARAHPGLYEQVHQLAGCKAPETIIAERDSSGDAPARLCMRVGFIWTIGSPTRETIWRRSLVGSFAQHNHGSFVCDHGQLRKTSLNEGRLADRGRS